jgi:hypothetical protein
LRWGYRPLALAGAAAVVVGSLMLLPLGVDSPVWLLPTAMFVQGIGFGLNFTTILLAVQNAVPWQQRGAATGLYQFSRNIGGTLAGAALGLVLTLSLGSRLAALPPGTLPPALDGAANGGGGHGSNLGAASLLLDIHTRASLPPATKTALIDALAGGLYPVLVALALLGVAAAVATWFFPRDIAVARRDG